MIKKRGHEIILGTKTDALFGSVILFGMGGVGVEHFGGVTVGLPPLTQMLARRLIEETKVYHLLTRARVVRVVHFSQLVVDFPQIKEMDINPLFIDEEGIIAIDARNSDRQRTCISRR